MPRNYILPVGNKDNQRLEAQHKCYQQGIRAAVMNSGLEKGQVVIDVGCGNGIMTEWLARQVGPKGMVFALDNNVEQLNQAKERLQTAGLQQVEFCQIDIESVDIKEFEADLTYCCYVIHHLENKVQGLKNLAHLTKRKGSVVIVEVLNSFAWIEPADPAFSRLFELFVQYTKFKKVNCDYGKKIFQAVSQIELFKDISIHGYNPITNDPNLKAMLFLQWQNIKQELLKLNMIDEDEKDELTQGLEAIVTNSEVIVGLPPAAIVQCKTV